MIKNRVKHSFISKLFLWIVKAVGDVIFSFRNHSVRSKVFFLTDYDNAVFFGYHDKTPFSSDNSRILAMSVKASDQRADSECTSMKLGYFEKDASGRFCNKFIPFSETTTWGWQQGCMLQWNPSDPDNEVVFNKLIDGKYGAVIFNLKTKQNIKKFDMPVYSVSSDGKFAVTLNFSRLGRLRPGYGYRLLPDKTNDQDAPRDDGLFLMDLNSGEKFLLLNLADLADEISRKNCQHYVNHATFSPDGKRIVFFHLWVDQAENRNMRFLCYNLESKCIEKIEIKDKVSHYCWHSDSKILATVQSGKINNWQFFFYTLNEKNVWEKTPAFVGMNTDGHPMKSPVEEEMFVSDSRLNRFREDQVVLFNPYNYKTLKVARFVIPFQYNGIVRCDLHPRWDREGRYVVVDTIKKGKRAMAVIEIEDNQKKLIK
ncbi:MAG: hypothetical protein ACOCQ4_00845 [bacterium]